MNCTQCTDCSGLQSKWTE